MRIFGKIVKWLGLTLSSILDLEQFGIKGHNAIPDAGDRVYLTLVNPGVDNQGIDNFAAIHTQDGGELTVLVLSRYKVELADIAPMFLYQFVNL